MDGVGDEVAPGPRDALEAAYGADGQAAENLDEEVVCKTGRRIPLSRGLLHLVGSWRQIPAVGVVPPGPAVGSQLSTSNTMACEENEAVLLSRTGAWGAISLTFGSVQARPAMAADPAAAAAGRSKKGVATGDGEHSGGSLACVVVASWEMNVGRWALR